MIPRFLLALGLAVLMVVTGVTSYVYLGSCQSRVAAPVRSYAMPPVSLEP